MRNEYYMGPNKTADNGLVYRGLNLLWNEDNEIGRWMLVANMSFNVVCIQ